MTMQIYFVHGQLAVCCRCYVNTNVSEVGRSRLLTSNYLYHKLCVLTFHGTLSTKNVNEYSYQICTGDLINLFFFISQASWQKS